MVQMNLPHAILTILAKPERRQVLADAGRFYVIRDHIGCSCFKARIDLS